jgi:hypothetical protein
MEVRGNTEKVRKDHTKTPPSSELCNYYTNTREQPKVPTVNFLTILLKNPTDSDLEHIPVSMVKNTLVIEEVELPLDSRMNGIVVIKVKSGSGRQSL